MKKLNRINVLLVMVAFITLSLSYNIYALASDNEYINIQPVASDYISVFSGELSKVGNEVYVSYSMIGYCDKLIIGIELQVYENGKWSTVKSWEKSSTSSMLNGTVSYTGVSTKQYRANIIYSAYNSGKVVETRTIIAY